MLKIKFILKDTYIEAFKIVREKKKYIELVIDEETTQKMLDLKESMSPYDLYTSVN